MFSLHSNKTQTKTKMVVVGGYAGKSSVKLVPEIELSLVYFEFGKNCIPP